MNLPPDIRFFQIVGSIFDILDSWILRLFAISDICHNYESFNTTYSDTSLFGVFVVCEPMQCFDAGRAVIRAAQSLTNDVTDAEINEAKKRLTNRVVNTLYCKHFIVAILVAPLLHLNFTFN